MAHPQYSAVSQTFCCKWCGADVVLAEELGGDLAYVCVAVNCGHACMVDAPEGLGVKAASWSSSAEPAGDDDSGETEPHNPVEERAPLGQRLARARAKAEYHLAGGLDIRQVDTYTYLVPSGTRGGVIHRVEQGLCSCEAGAAGKVCWHIEAVNALHRHQAAA